MSTYLDIVLTKRYQAWNLYGKIVLSNVYLTINFYSGISTEYHSEDSK